MVPMHTANLRERVDTVPPNARSPPEKFLATFPQAELDELRRFITASRVGPTTFDGLQQDRKYGITTQWLPEAKHAAWLESFNR